MNVKLVVVQGKPEGIEIPLQSPKFVIGRDPTCNLRPNNDLVSKFHCAFLIEGEDVFLEDAGSTNGTFVNGLAIKSKVELHDGDLVKVGALVFALKIPAKKSAADQTAEDGDDALQWLLGDAASPDGGIAEPEVGNTVMDMKLPVDGAAAESPTVEMKAVDMETAANLRVVHGLAKPEPAAKPNQGNTQDAATEILNKYMVRRRTL